MRGFKAAILSVLLVLISCGFSFAVEFPVSDATAECLECHGVIHPGIVEDWLSSRHAQVTPAQALQVEGAAARMSAKAVPEDLKNIVVGCAECHLMNPEAHPGSFEHNGEQVHMVVSPADCATCHPVETEQYAKNMMALAHKNLDENQLYQQHQQVILGTPAMVAGKLEHHAADAQTRADGCFYCHGTRLELAGTITRDTDLGEMEFPQINGWPNQGVGRVNLDGSRGSCTACHTRHGFSIEMARKPYTCKECHVGPDVPAYKVYAASKHGNLYSTHQAKWDFTAVPWTVGQDIKAPTCAVCHVSLMVNTDGETISERTHKMSDRLPWRIFGLIYAHPHPRDADTTMIRNAQGQPLPTSLDGQLASDYLIDETEMRARTQSMQAICLNCHGSSWVGGFWNRFENTIQTTNAAILTATQLMQTIWKDKLAQGLEQGGNPFDETPEKIWTDLWLFHANTIRFSSAMAGGGDYGVFAQGRYQLSQKIRELRDWYSDRGSTTKDAKAGNAPPQQD